MNTYTLKNDLEIVIEECIECGAQFGMTKVLHTYKKDHKKSFYCPNGHSMNYAKSLEDKLREEISEKEATIKHLRDRETKRLSELAKKREARNKRK